MQKHRNSKQMPIPEPAKPNHGKYQQNPARSRQIIGEIRQNVGKMGGRPILDV